MASSPTESAKPGNAVRSGRPRRILRALWKVLRTTFVLCLLFLLIAILYLNQVGLPERVKEHLMAGLRAKGWDVQYARLRLSVRRPGVIAENLYLHRTNLWSGPQIYVQEARCRFRGNALKKLEVQFESARLVGARLLWPLAKTNQLEGTLLINNIGGEVFFHRNDAWELQALRGTILGLQLNVSGVVSNGSLLRDWKLPRPARPATRATYNRWQRILEIAEQVRFSGSPELAAQFNIDAADIDTLQASLLFHVAGFESPWATGTNLLLSAYSQPTPESDQPHRLQLDCLLERASTPWIKGEGLRFNSEFSHTVSPWTVPTNFAVHIEARELEHKLGRAANLAGTSFIHLPATNTIPRFTDWQLSADTIRTRWGDSRSANMGLSVQHGTTNWLPHFVSNVVQVTEFESKWGTAAFLHVNAGGEFVSENVRTTNILDELRLSGIAQAQGVSTGEVHSDEIQIRGEWSAPEFKLQIDGNLEEGQLHGGATLDLRTGQLTFRGNTSFDPHRLSSLMTTNTRRWLANYEWEKPPLLQAQGTAQVPVPLSANVDWGRQVMPTLAAQGEFQIGKCAYRRVPFDSARSPFSFTNSVFHLPEIVVTRPEGSAQGAYTSRPLVKQFHWKLMSNIDPQALRPLFKSTNELRIFDMVQFTAPPKVSAEIWGDWRDLDRLGVVANVAATNFVVRGQKVSFGESLVLYTNRVIECLNPFVIRQQETGTAARVAIDIGQKKIFFTNAIGNLNPYALTAAIGKSASRAIAPYQFAIPPHVQLNGVLDIRRGGWQDDMHFKVSGGPFFWEPFHAQQVSGQIHWMGKSLILSDILANLHNGQAKGDARFQFEKSGAQFAFNAQWSDIALRSLMTDLSDKTNEVEGTLRGELQVTSAHTTDLKTWNGRGLVELKDGLIWDFPVFGMFSPILNNFAPGLGNSKARDASASYVMTNSVIYTEDLQIHASAMRMQFNGTLDFDRNIKGRMEAELLRDVPAIGLVLSKLLWPVTKIFEYRIYGTLQEPKTDPIYIIPKIILFPFSPLKTLKDVFTSEPEQK